jgi:hypothetical protein
MSRRVLLSVPASLPTLGNVLTTSSEGEGTIRIAISPGDVAEVATALASLGGRTFYLTLVALPEVKRPSALATEAAR